MNNRQETINNFIQKYGEVNINDLIAMFPDVSSMTIRRDLNYLESLHHIVRTRGGAKSISHLTGFNKEDSYSKRASTNTKGKSEIASKALEFIKPGRSVFIDAGSTMMAFAKMIPNHKYYFFTNAPDIAMELINHSEAVVNLIGGELNRDNLCLSGQASKNFIENINIDIAFVAASGFSSQSGFTVGDFYESELKRILIKKANMVIMLMDSSKENISLPYSFSNINEVDVLISDSNISKDFKNTAQEAGIQIL